MEKRKLQPLSEECGSSVSFPQEVDTENNCCMEDYHHQSTSYFKSPQKTTHLKRPHPTKSNLKKSVFTKQEPYVEDADPQGSGISEVESSEDQSSDVSGIRKYESYIHGFVENATSSKGKTIFLIMFKLIVSRSTSCNPQSHLSSYEPS